MPTATTLPTDDAERIETAVSRGVSALEAGELVVFPTETVYGIAAAVTRDAGIEALERFKNRPTQPFSLHMGDPTEAVDYVDFEDPLLKRLLEKLMPGPITVVADASEAARERCRARFGLESHQLDRLYHEGTIGLRAPQDRIAQRLLSRVNGPVVASSANPRGGRPPQTAEDAAAAVGDAAALVIDGGPTRYARPSTVVRVQGSAAEAPRWSLLREGVYEARMIEKVLPWTVLFVCSGNTCRSPIAATLAESLLEGPYADAVREIGHRVLSAGISAEPGSQATEEAVAVAEAYGGDLSRHRAKPFTAEMAHEADVILCMTEPHRQSVVATAPAAAEKTMRLDPEGDVPDPVGAGRSVYDECARRIQAALRTRFETLLRAG